MHINAHYPGYELSDDDKALCAKIVNLRDELEGACRAFQDVTGEYPSCTSDLAYLATALATARLRQSGRAKLTANERIAIYGEDGE